MHRLLIHLNDASPMPEPFLPDVLIEPDKEEARHAIKVLRLHEGDDVELLNGQGSVAQGKITQIKPKLLIKVTEVTQVEPLSPHLTLATAIPKGGRAGDMVNQLSQLGVDCLIPLQTQRGVVKPRENKLQRFERIAQESAKQCGRAHLMHLAKPQTLAQLADQPFDEKRIGLPTAPTPAPGSDPGFPNNTLGHASSPAPATVLVVIGPEGGFTDEEIQVATEAGFIPWRFAPHILRIETAAVAAAAIWRSFST